MKIIIILILLWFTSSNIIAQSYTYYHGKDTITGDFKDVHWWNKVVAKNFSHGEYLVVTKIQPELEFDIYCNRIGLPTVNPYMTWILEDEYIFNQICIGQEFAGSNHGTFYNLR